MVLQPQNNFTVVRQISDHTDTGTYYVRAVIRNAYTDAIITTLDLEDKTGQRFKKDWQVPADPSGQGFYISIVTSVYTDSGYTTKSPSYGDEENTYLIQDRILNMRGGGGGIDAFTVRKIVSEEIAKIPEVKIPEVEIPEYKQIDRTDEVLKAVSNIKIKETNLKPLETAVALAIKEIKQKEVTPKTDLSPVLLAIDKKLSSDNLNSLFDKMFLKFEKPLGDALVEQVNKGVEDIMLKIINIIVAFIPAGEKKKPVVEQPKIKSPKKSLDITKLSI